MTYRIKSRLMTSGVLTTKAQVMEVISNLINTDKRQRGHVVPRKLPIEILIE